MGAGGLVQVARCGGEYVAIKRIEKILCHDDHVRESTLNERRILARLAEERAQDETKHPLIIKLLAAFQNNESLYLMLVSAQSIRGRPKRSRTFAFPRRLLRFHIYELCTAVVGLHEAGIIHRDIKPENILIDRQGHIVVCDFGLAAESSGVEPLKLVSPSWMRWRDTVALTFAEDKMVGTEYYTAPEILLGWAYSTAVDWWSVGAVMYHMWTSMVRARSFLAVNWD
ncbi:kinase-like protein [Schizophyllum commune Loenen D]|nr:kinase-like protein [Schizophyllum commune Loenen D]